MQRVVGTISGAYRLGNTATKNITAEWYGIKFNVKILLLQNKVARYTQYDSC